MLCSVGLGPALTASAQDRASRPLPVSQIEELDREGAGIRGSLSFPLPPIDCVDVLDRVAGSQLRYLTRNAGDYLVLPNGDVVAAPRALRLRDLEDQIRMTTGSRRERLERSYHELAPGGPRMVVTADGQRRFDEDAAEAADQGDTVYSYIGLPPLYERPLSPQPDTLAAHILLGSRLESPEHTDFRILQQTDHWLIGTVTGPSGVASPRIAVHRTGARIIGDRLERAAVLWPLNRTAESRREFYDRPPLPLYVALGAETLRASPERLACAAENGRVILRNPTARAERTRTVQKREVADGSGFVRVRREHGPWNHTVTWRSNPVRLRIIDRETHVARRDRRIGREDQRPNQAGLDRSGLNQSGFEQRVGNNPDSSSSPAAAPRVTHRLALTDGRTLRGRLLSEPGADTIEFVVVVASIEQTLAFQRTQIDKLERLEPEDR
ncbi:MAG: hypothetical protein AAGF47_08025 [Planctomycetota bacterium]